MSDFSYIKELDKQSKNLDTTIGPRMTITMEPKEYEQAKLGQFIMRETRLLCACLEMFFSLQGLKKVTITWDNLNLVRHGDLKKEDLQE